MVYLNRIYTRSGDGGETSLGDGERVPKTSPRIAALGALDELNASLGVALATSNFPAGFQELLSAIQNDLFDLGADVCLPATAANEQRQPLRISKGAVENLEHLIDGYNADLPSLTSFILPGGTPAAAQLHWVRTLCRRVEIDVLRLAAAEHVNPMVPMYLNRMSDLLFVLARCCNHVAGGGDVLWAPGGRTSAPP